nr:MAG: hypothetical protein H3BulkLitter1752_000002 [Astroviridae sp.]
MPKIDVQIDTKKKKTRPRRNRTKVIRVAKPTRPAPRRPRSVKTIRVHPQPKRLKTRRNALSKMQRNAIFGSGSATLLRAIADPRNATPVRLPEKTSTRKTALANPFEFIRPVLTNGGGTSDSDMWGVLGRHPCRQLIFRDSNMDTKPYTYNVAFTWLDTGATQNGTAYPFAVDGSINLTDGVPLPIVYASATTAYMPHGPRLYAGMVSKIPMSRFLWVNAADTLTFSLSTTLNQPLNIELIYYQNGVISYHQNNIAASSLTNTFATIGEGYLAVNIQTVASNVTTQALSMTISNAGSGYITSHRAMPSLEALLVGNVNIRSIGSSVRIQNNASVLTGGSITAVQLPGKVDWTSYVYTGLTASVPSVPDFGAVSTVQTLPFNKGFYTYVKIDEEADFNFHDDFVIRNGVIQDSKYHIDKGNFVLWAGSGIGASSTSTYAPNWIIERTMSVEFETTDNSRAVASSEEPYAMLVEALDALKHAPQFMENPTHATAIMQALKKYGTGIVKGVVKYGPTVLSAAKLLAGLVI